MINKKKYSSEDENEYEGNTSFKTKGKNIEMININKNNNLGYIGGNNDQLDHVFINKNNEKLSNLKSDEMYEEDNSDRLFKIDDEDDDQKGRLQDFTVKEDEDMDVFQIIDGLNHSTNLNRIIEAVNTIMKRKKKLTLKNDFVTTLTAKELDKFNLAKKMRDNFRIVITYNMEEDN